MNYAKHLEEADKLGVARSKHQVWFNKQTSCLSGPYDDIDPGVTEKLDYEVELGVVIGAAAKHVSEADAPAHVFGYFVANDVSARDWQFHSPTFTMGKSFDTYGPIGPWIVTADDARRRKLFPAAGKRARSHPLRVSPRRSSTSRSARPRARRST